MKKIFTLTMVLLYAMLITIPAYGAPIDFDEYYFDGYDKYLTMQDNKKLPIYVTINNHPTANSSANSSTGISTKTALKTLFLLLGAAVLYFKFATIKEGISTFFQSLPLFFQVKASELNSASGKSETSKQSADSNGSDEGAGKAASTGSEESWTSAALNWAYNGACKIFSSFFTCLRENLRKSLREIASMPTIPVGSSV
ncbi:MAG: hypothetical protein IJ758_02465 [Clostridia bacterium]|nr:hypothetical protein [Clostridia bacterium]